MAEIPDEEDGKGDEEVEEDAKEAVRLLMMTDFRVERGERPGGRVDEPGPEIRETEGGWEKGG